MQRMFPPAALSAAPISALMAVLLAALMAPAVLAGPAERPCFNVEVQNDRNNRSEVRQDCQRNYNRTVQAGADNRALTVQTGEINSNQTRQYSFDPRRFGDRLRGQ